MGEAKPGSVNWRDLTVADARPVAEFYRDVAGWEIQPMSMGDYDDYSMVIPGTKEEVAGVCHARGTNAGIPAQWMIYITVEDLDASVAKCVELGGEVLGAPRPLGDGRWSVIRDPAGAVAALYEE